jgi:hypothetical protein
MLEPLRCRPARHRRGRVPRPARGLHRRHERLPDPLRPRAAGCPACRAGLGPSRLARRQGAARARHTHAGSAAGLQSQTQPRRAALAVPCGSPFSPIAGWRATTRLSLPSAKPSTPSRPSACARAPTSPGSRKSLHKLNGMSGGIVSGCVPDSQLRAEKAGARQRARSNPHPLNKLADDVIGRARGL